MKKVKMYFKGGKGILKPVDVDGMEIKEGDILTPDSWGRDDSYFHTFFPKWTSADILEWKNRPLYKVKWNDKGFFYGEGIEQYLYLHDFRFKYCKKINNEPKVERSVATEVKSEY